MVCYYTWLDDDSMRLDQERNAIEEDDGSNPSPPQDHLSLLCPTGPWLGKTRGSAGGPRSGRAGQGRLEQNSAGQSCMPGHLKPSQTHEEASATGTPFPGPLHLTHTGYKSKERGRVRVTEMQRCAVCRLVAGPGRRCTQLAAPRRYMYAVLGRRMTRCVRAAGGNPTQPKSPRFLFKMSPSGPLDYHAARTTSCVVH